MYIFLYILFLISLCTFLVWLDKENTKLSEQSFEDTIAMIKAKKEIESLKKEKEYLNKQFQDAVVERNNLKDSSIELKKVQGILKEEKYLLQEKLNKTNKELASLKDFKRKIDDAYSVGTYCRPIHDHLVENSQRVGITVAQGCGQTPKFTKMDRT